MAIRTITFEATLDGISPKAPQNAGIQGEHNATTVVINLSPQLVTEINKPNTYYRFEFVDCMGQFDTTENFTLSSGALSVNIDIPNGWTSSGGNAELRLVIVRLNVDNNEEMILYSLPCKLKFEGRDTGTGLTPETVEKGLSGLIADVTNATINAQAAATSALDATSYANTQGDYAKSQGDYAKVQGDYAKSQGDYAELQGNYAKAKGDYADEYGAAARVATDSATAAAAAANAAANSANTAANAANAAANSANTAANNANQAADNANQAAEAARQALDDIENMVADGVATANSYTDTVTAGKVDKVEGKGLSTNDYTNADKAKVENLPENTNAELALKANAADVEAALSDKADTSYVIANLEALNTSKADKSALSETNLRVAEIGKDLSDYKAVLVQLNPNQEAKQTVSDYGRVSLPVNAASGHMSAVVGGVTVTQLEPNGRAFCNNIAAFNHHYYSPVVTQNADNIEVAIPEGRTETYFGWDTDTYLKPDAYYFIKIDLEWVSGTDLYFRPCNSAGGVYRWRAQNGRHTLFGKFKAPIDLGGNNDWHVFQFLGAAGDSFKIYKISQYEISADEYNSLSNDKLSKRYDFLPYGTHSTVSAMRIVSESEDKSQRTELYIPDVGGMRSTGTVRDEISCNQQTGQWVHIMRVGDDGVALSNPITAPVNVSGTLLSYPKGIVYSEPVLPVAGIYTANGISVTNTDFPIESIERIYKIDFATGVETEINPSSAVVAGNGLSFTHPGLAAGDIVFFTYYHSVTGTNPKLTLSYYDSRYTVKDSVTNKFYRWRITVANGVPSIVVEEVS